VNGILFTGGDTELYLNNSSPGYTYNKFVDTASFIFMKALIQNREGKFFPVMGTCQGF
jgi:gamma-glutamyl hydrolase